MHLAGNTEVNALERELISDLGTEKLKEIGQDIAEIIRKNKLQNRPVLCKKLFTYVSCVIDGWNCV